VFRKNGEMYVYQQSYEQGVDSVEPLVCYVTFYRGKTKALETTPLKVTDGMANRLKTMPLRCHIPLSKLSPGEYNCQVTVLNPMGRKAAFWQAPVMVVP
jgi:hypothetical protein